MMRSRRARYLQRVFVTLISAFALASALYANGAHASQSASAASSTLSGGEWAVDPTTAGDNVPSVGRSLFDFLVVRKQGERKVYDVPFPFTALVKRLESELQPDQSRDASVKAVLIPLGRSLQRTSAAPEFFAYPRVVLAADAEARVSANSAGMLLKDRVYLGYQEKENLIEVISYNEAAGRFEFQVVKDYRARGDAQVRYANRAVCIACHQNAAPLFSRQVWDETNANPRIAALLRKQKRTFYGIDPERGVDVPNAIDDATDRANLYSAYQLLWRGGCMSDNDEERALRCRANLFAAALQYRLSGKQHFDNASPAYREYVLAAIARSARVRWPKGLHIPNPDIPNRDPFMSRTATVAETATTAREGVSIQTSFAENVDVLAAFDPLAPRRPLETWSVAEPATLARLVTGLSEFLAEADVHRVDAQLYGLSMRREAPQTMYGSDCEIRSTRRAARVHRIDFDCSTSSEPDERRMTVRGQLYAHGAKLTAGRVDRLRLGAGTKSGELADIDVAGGTIVRSGERTIATLRLARAGGHARRGDGDRLEMMRLTWSEAASGGNVQTSSSSGRAVLKVVHDFASVQNAIEQMVRDNANRRLDVFSDKPFRRASLMPALFQRMGMKPLRWCCLEDAGMPPPVMEAPANVTGPGAHGDARPANLQPFFRYCATCHQSNDRSPPNFLQGTANQVSAKLSHCAQRLYVRLTMWQLAPGQRPKTPMPPEYAVYGLHGSPQGWRDGGDLAALRVYVERALRAETGSVPRPEEFLSRGYENLRSCLP
jgi:mono/diheme cytochrome c family protein